MSAKYQISPLTRNIIVAGLAAFLLVFFVYSMLATRSWIGRPFPGFVVLKNNLVPIMGAPGWVGFEKGVKFGDVVTKIDGAPVTDGDDLNDRVVKLEPGTPVTYTIVRRDKELEITVPVSVFTLSDYLMLFPLIMGVGSLLYIAGLVVFFVKPNTAAGRAFLVNGVILGITMAAAPGFSTNHTNFIVPLTLPLVGPSFTLLACYFPETFRYRRPVLAISFGTAFALVIGYTYSYLFLDVWKYIIFDTIMIVLISINNMVALLTMPRSFYRSTDPFTRQKAKIVVYGLTMTGMGSLGFVFGNLIFKIMVCFWFLPVSLTLMPLSISYAIVKNNLFDVDTFIRRTAGYVVLTVVVVVLFFLTVAGLSFVLQGFIGQATQASSVLATLAMVAVARPIHDRIRDSIDRRFYRERAEYQQTLRKASKVLSKIIDKDRLLNELLDTIMDAVKIERGVLLLRDEGSDTFIPAVERDYSEGFQAFSSADESDSDLSYPASHPLFQSLSDIKRALQKNDIDRPGVFGKDSEPMIEAMDRMRVILVIPVIYEYRMIGVLGLSPKRTGAWYSSDDIDLLRTLMDQAAISIENARSVEEMKRIVAYEASYRELKKLDELKDNFMAMVSHDLRTPMAGIMAYASIIRDSIETIDKEKEKKYLDVVIEQSQRMTRLINDLLDVQKFEAEKMDMVFDDLDLKGLVTRCVALFEGAAAEKNITLKTEELPPENIMVSGSADRLEQVMINLISNAVKFTPEQGVITVGLDVLSRDGNRAARVAVTDTGPGIPADIQDKIFEKFVQLDAKYRGSQRGSGLGLALVREIVQAHNGRVGVESDTGTGSTFFFLLPIKEGIESST